MLILAGTIFIFICCLVLEKILLDRRVQSVPLRIAVTGTRGKTSVVRMLAAVLEESGRKVMAKTTGSRARLIFPDGNEEDVRRRGFPSIIEQKRLLKKAVENDVECLVAEVMSIQLENHFVECQKIVKPNIVIVTNVRKDHVDAMGHTEDEIGGVLALDIPEGAKVFIPESEIRPAFHEAAYRMRAEIMPVQAGISAKLSGHDSEIMCQDFLENLDLTYTVATHLGIGKVDIARGIRNTEKDIGALSVWRIKSIKSDKFIYAINAFAANEPESTNEIISIVENALTDASSEKIGIVNMRSDRGDRTQQWMEALNTHFGSHFCKLYYVGSQSRILQRRLGRGRRIGSVSPEEIMELIMDEAKDRSMIFGLGNMDGMGMRLVQYWERVGELHGV